MAEDPVRMFKYLMIKCISGLSDVDLVDKCMYDMSYKYFLGLAPEDRVIESSTLSKFRKLRLQDVNLLGCHRCLRFMGHTCQNFRAERRSCKMA